MRTQVWSLLIAISCSAVAFAQIVGDMSSDRIREAIALGTKARDLEPYRINEGANWSPPFKFAVYTTPFLRVALAAYNAKKQYKQFTEADVQPSMLAPEVEVYASSQPIEGTQIANVETIVLLPYKGKDRSTAILPTRTSALPDEYRNLYGFVGRGGGMLAVFPLDAWQENNELHVVFDKPVAFSGSADVKSRIYLRGGAR